ncbi:metalloendopeptidase OMA1, mitochondrial-like isoform X2 [Daktulosphaira vitifoliae]|nr:metalloendopeptidase OMA1, mitochondrial-like isoform X2 [Daktulosphaira vitifoliae]
MIQYFSVSSIHRLPLPPLAALVIRPIAKFFAMVLGIQIRRWYMKLSEEEKQKFWYNVQKRRKQIYYSIFCAFSLLTIYCTLHLEIDPITGKRRFIIFTQQQMTVMANSMAKELIDENKSAVLQPSDPQYRRALKIAMRIIDANKQYDLVEDRKWFLVVINDSRINAMVLPNGMIIVFTGLLNLVNDEQVGVVIAHEIAHCLLNHHAIRLSREHLLEMLWLIPLTLMWALMPIPEAILGYILGNYFKNLTLLLPYERDQEIEADKYGLLLAANACLDVRQALVFWNMMNNMDKLNDKIWWTSTHPSHTKRINYIENLMPYALKLRQQNGCPPVYQNFWSNFSFFN